MYLYLSDLRRDLDSVRDVRYLVPVCPHVGAGPGHQQTRLQGSQEADHEVRQQPLAIDIILTHQSRGLYCQAQAQVPSEHKAFEE